MTTARVRRRLDTESRRLEILDAALEVLAHREVSQTSITEIAERADSSPALVHHYFGSKDRLAATALSRAADELVSMMQVDATGTVEEQLDEGLGTYLEFLATHPVSWSALLRAGADQTSPLAAVARRVDDHATTLSLGALTGGHPESTDSLRELAVRGWLELVKATCLTWLTTGEPSREVLHDFLARSFLGCVQAAEATRTQ